MIHSLINGEINMKYQWTEFQGSPNRRDRTEPRVSLNPRGVIFFNRKAFAAMGEPAAVRLFFDENRLRIGLKPTDPSRKNAFPVRKKDRWENRVVQASPFCRHNKIRIDRTVVFNEVDLDDEGILTLDLNKTTSIGREPKSAK